MKLLVVGDYIEDRYVFGTASRLCPEAPVPVIVPQSARFSPGGAGLVVEQLNELGADVVMFYGSHSVKERFFAGNHLILRVDNDSIGVQPGIPSDEHLEQVDAIVVSDYGKGAMTQGLAAKLIETGKPLFVDAKNTFWWYRGPNVWCFPNEYDMASGTFRAEDKQIVRKMGAKGCEMGKLQIPATVSEVVDVTGAGDIFMAGFVYAWTLQLPAEDCLRFANALAGESCRHIGTFVVGRAFAQAELDRLRASKESAPQNLASSPGSSSPKNRSWRVSGLYTFPNSLGKDGNLHADLPQAVGGQEAYFEIPPDGQIPHQLPSDPIESNGAPLPKDQESSDEQDRRLR